MNISKEVLIIIGRSIITIFTLFIVTKILGKKQLSQLTIFDYIIGITIGSIAADAITALDEHIVNGLVALITFGILGYGLSYISIKSSSANTLLNGKPTILMEHGEFNLPNLEDTKISITKFIEEARLKGYFDLTLINYAILETNGQISFLPKEEYQPSNIEDFTDDIKSKIPKQTMCKSLIIDGEVNLDILESHNKDTNWLKNELKKLKVSSKDKILLATIDEKNKIRIYKEH